jgi:hypothetical protein
MMCGRNSTGRCYDDHTFASSGLSSLLHKHKKFKRPCLRWCTDRLTGGASQGAVLRQTWSSTCHCRIRLTVEDEMYGVRKPELKHYQVMFRQLLAEYEQLEPAASSEHAIAMMP